MSDELRLDYKMHPGDMALVNNLTMLHAKTAFKVGEICRSSDYHCPASIHLPAPATSPFDPSLPPPPPSPSGLH